MGRGGVDRGERMGWGGVERKNSGPNNLRVMVFRNGSFCFGRFFAHKPEEGKCNIVIAK